MQIGVPAETAAGETRVAVTPETAKKLKSQGHSLHIQSGAGLAASVTDEAYVAAGAEITDAAGALGAELVLKVRAPSDAEAAHMKAGATLVGMLNPFDAAGLRRLAQAGLTSFALEAAPRTTRAQSMDVLSSQANIAGYKAVMIAADKYQRFFPMLMTAAGTVKAARVVILGVGVAGLQAIATAKRLGAVIEPPMFVPVSRSRWSRWAPSSLMCPTRPMKKRRRQWAWGAMRVPCRRAGSTGRRWR